MKFNSTLLFVLVTAPFLLLNKVQAQSDFGDAPDPTYPTLAASNGAQHLLSPLFLGALVDGEINGQPGPQASGDDVNGITDDEDGVMFSSWVIPGQSATVIVTASAPGFLDAWIDFQGNGNWIDPGEQIFFSLAINAGQNILQFPVPAGALPGFLTFGRFRLSSAGGLQPTGMAFDGEVEDYQIFIGPPPAGLVIMDPDPGLSYTQNEISMAVVAGSGNLIAAYNDQPYPGGPGIGVSFSLDQGISWNPSQLTVPNNPFSGVPFLDAFDPSVACDMAGNVFVAHISTDFNWATGPVSGLFVHHSANGGLTWNPPVTVDANPGAIGSPDPNYRFNDRCQIRIDRNPSSPFFNNIYIAWLKDRGWNMPMPNSDIYVSVSADGGATFSPATQINHITNALGNLPIPEVAANGDLYVLWVDYNVITGGNGVMLLDKSVDGGMTWGPDIIVNTIPLPPLNLNGGTDAQAKGAAILRADPSNPNQLYITYAADPDGLAPDEGDIFFIKSTDGGNSWTPPLRINDDVSTNDQVLPWMEVKSNGLIDIVWYDRRNDPADLLWDVFVTSSTDGGTTFAPNTQVNPISSQTPQTNSGPWFGEYLGLAVSDTMAFIGYTSSAMDILGDVAFTSFVNPIITSSHQNLNESPFGLKLFPNPTENRVTIEFQEKVTKAEITITDLTGKVMLKTEVNESQRVEFNTGDLGTGIYFVRVQGADFVETRKLLLRK